MKLKTLAAVVGLGLALSAAPASAATILVFGQNGLANTITGTANGGQTATTISGTDISVTITAIENIVGSVQAFFSFTATSTNSASLVGGDVQQNYSGSWSFWSGAGGTGTNYLSGTFGDILVGTNLGNGFTMTSNTPGDSVTFTSDVITSLLLDRAMSLSFTNVLTNVSICGTTLCSFTASVSGNYAGNPPRVPEPGSLALLGLGLVGLGLIRRKA